jgi:hypothetical protein
MRTSQLFFRLLESAPWLGMDSLCGGLVGIKIFVEMCRQIC